MPKVNVNFSGVELYFDDLERAKSFYRDVLGLTISDEDPGHHAKFDNGAGFICLECKGAENYPSKDKAVLFFEVQDLTASLNAIGRDLFVRIENTWAVLHDPEGHNILLLEKKN